VRNLEWQALQALKEIYRLLRRKTCPQILEYPVDSGLALYLLNKKRKQLHEMEQTSGRTIEIVSAPKG
jgi:ribonuclease E